MLNKLGWNLSFILFCFGRQYWKWQGVCISLTFTHDGSHLLLGLPGVSLFHYRVPLWTKWAEKQGEALYFSMSTFRECFAGGYISLGHCTATLYGFLYKKFKSKIQWVHQTLKMSRPNQTRQVMLVRLNFCAVSGLLDSPCPLYSKKHRKQI